MVKVPRSAIKRLRVQVQLQKLLPPERDLNRNLENHPCRNLVETTHAEITHVETTILEATFVEINLVETTLYKLPL